MLSSVLTLLVSHVRMKPETIQQQGAGVHHRSLQPTKTLLCSVNVTADQLLGAESAAGLVNNESQALFLFPEMSIQTCRLCFKHVLASSDMSFASQA